MRIRNLLSAVAIASVVGATAGVAQASDEERHESESSRFELHGYAVINYDHFAWQTAPSRRASVDLERFILEPEVHVTPKLEFEAEIEIEHGGTGATLEFDPAAASGEVEQQIEKGGEITIEKLQVTYAWKPDFGLRAGRLYVPIGALSSHDEPDEYFTTTRNEAERALIPTVWHESGVELFGRAGRVGYRVLLVTGLDASGFGSATWVRGGFQQRFETVNAANLAAVGRLSLRLASTGTVSLAGYYGNSSGNRPQADLPVSAYVGILSADAELERGPLTARGLVMYGHLQNAAAVSQANQILSDDPDPTASAVGSAALAWFGEVGYDVMPRLGAARSAAGQRLDLFARYDWYDTMFETAFGIADDPRWRRRTWTAGANWRPDPHVIVKAQYGHRLLGLPTANREATASLGLALLF